MKTTVPKTLSPQTAQDLLTSEPWEKKKKKSCFPTTDLKSRTVSGEGIAQRTKDLKLETLGHVACSGCTLDMFSNLSDPRYLPLVEGVCCLPAAPGCCGRIRRLSALGGARRLLAVASSASCLPGRCLGFAEVAPSSSAGMLGTPTTEPVGACRPQTASLALEAWLLGFYSDLAFDRLVRGQVRSLQASLHM